MKHKQHEARYYYNGTGCFFLGELLCADSSKWSICCEGVWYGRGISICGVLVTIHRSFSQTELLPQNRSPFFSLIAESVTFAEIVFLVVIRY